MDIGDIIRLKRKSHRLTQQELSEILEETSSERISYLERSPRAILSFNVDKLYILSDVLDIDIDLLIEERNKLKNK